MWRKIDETFNDDNCMVIETYAMDVGMGVVLLMKTIGNQLLSTTSTFVPGMQVKGEKLVVREGYGQVPTFDAEQLARNS